MPLSLFEFIFKILKCFCRSFRNKVIPISPLCDSNIYFCFFEELFKIDLRREKIVHSYLINTIVFYRNCVLCLAGLALMFFSVKYRFLFIVGLFRRFNLIDLKIYEIEKNTNNYDGKPLNKFIY